MIESIDDLSALAWVQDELRRSLDAAHKALRRYLKESEAVADSDTDAVDPGVLRSARAQLHQGVGALELVGLPAAATLLRASESAVARLGTRGVKPTGAAIDTIEFASFALLDYLQRMLAGKPVSPLAFFPQYRAVQELAGADRVHPADLWPHDWRWRALPPDPSAVPHAADAQARVAAERQTLALMRQPSPAAAQTMSDLFAGLGAGASHGHLAAVWQLAAAFFEGQAHGLVRTDLYGKRMGSRLLALLRAVEGGGGQGADVSSRLAQDLLFFCAHAGASADGTATPRLAAVRRAWQLTASAAEDYDSSRLGRYDPAWVAQARKRVAGARDGWSGAAGGELHRLGSLSEQFSLVGESLKRLYPQGETLADALRQAAVQAAESAAAPPPALAMEVATALLYLDASLEDADFDHPEQAPRVERLARRIAAVAGGAAPEPLEAWMEELYRRVSDRQTMGSVVQELRASLAESEKLIDAYFRDPSQRELLIPVPAQLQAMRGVLSVLGLEQASQAVLRMRDEVDGMLQTEVDTARVAQAGTFDRLAGNLGALGFLIDMLGVQPQMAKSLFAYDADSGLLRSVVGGGAVHRASAFGSLDEAPAPAPAQAPADPALVEQAQSLALAAAHPEVSLEAMTLELEQLSHDARAADQTALADTAGAAQAALDRADDDASRQAVRVELAQAMAEFVASQSGVDTLAPEVAPPVAPASAPIATGLEDDDEMREVFLDEAREVLVDARQALSRLAAAPDDMAELTTVRRAFHTLKGSSRMVGLAAFGEAAWAGEQLYNARLAEAPRADGELLGFSADALVYLHDWVEHIADDRDGGHDAARVREIADALRAGGARAALLLPATEAAARATEVPAEPEADASAVPVDEPAFETIVLDDERAATADGAAAWPQADDLPAVDALAAEPLPLPSVDVAEAAEPEPAAALPPIDEAPATEGSVSAEPPAADQFKQVGPLAVPIPLFNIYLNEADEQSRRLGTELAEWALELHRPVGETAIALAHSLAGNSATVGFQDLSQLARALEHALMRSQALGTGRDEEVALFIEAADEIRRLLHQFAAGFLRSVPAGLVERLAEHEQHAAERLQTMAAELDGEPVDSGTGTLPGGLDEAPIEIERISIDGLDGAEDAALSPALAPYADAAEPEPEPVDAGPISAMGELGHVELKAYVPRVDEPVAPHAARDALDDDEDLDAVDAIDAELFPIFEEEGQELLPQLAGRLRDWARSPGDAAGAASCMRTLHTLKGGARLAGAMRLGEMAHRLETAIEHLLARGDVAQADVDALQGRVDALSANFEALRARDAAAEAAAPPAETPPAPAVVEDALAAVEEPLAPLAPATPADDTDPAPAIDWSRFADTVHAPRPHADRTAAAGVAHGAVRVRAPLLDRLVNHAGEVSITRSRIEAGVGQLKGSLGDLTENLERLRRQLRDIEIQAETQIGSRMEAAKAASRDFDPLEMDRFTRFQELTRMMAESVNDVATVQRALQRTLQSAEDDLAAQARLTRDLQDDLLRTRMVEFEGLSDRLYRVVRQAAKETGKQVRLDIVGGSIEVDRGVLDRMTGAFEHLLRNSVTHGIEPPADRQAAGKEAAGQITVSLAQEGNEVGVEFRDDGAGLKLDRIRERGVAMGLLAPDSGPTDADLANLIFMPGFSTADEVTELAGRGIGMDVVRSDVIAMGGRIETATAPGLGTTFRLVLPLTTAVTQVVMLRAGLLTVAVPSTLVETVRRATPADVDAAYASGTYAIGDAALPFFWLGALLQASPRGTEGGRTLPVVVIRSAQQRVALHVDEVLGNQEVVVKHLGSQLARLPGLAGMTLLASGSPALIYNPVALATLYGDAARRAMRDAAAEGAAVPAAEAAPTAPRAPLVLVVDDSLTVRRVTQRLLAREGYRVALAKDGLEGLERLAEELPSIVLSDIEMPRMDGFDLVRTMRGDARLRSVPVVMITSRIAQKHRDHAAELGVDHYLGKPYAEEDLLSLVARYVAPPVSA